MDQKIKLPSLPSREEALMAFGATLTKLRLKPRKSRYRLSKYIGIDQAYINRLETGNRQNPSRDVGFHVGLSIGGEFGWHMPVATDTTKDKNSILVYDAAPGPIF